MEWFFHSNRVECGRRQLCKWTRAPEPALYCYCTYRDSEAYFLGNFFHFSQAEFYRVLAGSVFKMVQEWA